MPKPMTSPREACTCFKLRSLTRQVTALYDSEILPTGLTVTQFSMLAVLMQARTEGTAPTIGEFARAMVMDRTTVTRGIAPLLELGLVRYADAKAQARDARSKLLEITPAGERAWHDARPAWRRAQARLQALLGEAMYAGLRVDLDRAHALLGV